MSNQTILKTAIILDVNEVNKTTREAKQSSASKYQIIFKDASREFKNNYYFAAYYTANIDAEDLKNKKVNLKIKIINGGYKIIEMIK